MPVFFKTIQPQQQLELYPRNCYDVLDRPFLKQATQTHEVEKVKDKPTGHLA